MSKTETHNFLDDINKKTSLLTVNDLEMKKNEGAKRLSYTRRISSANLDTGFFTKEIKEKFRIVEQLGLGAFAQVWKVQDRKTLEEFALKIVFRNRVSNQVRLTQEIKALQIAKHNTIIELKEIFSDENHIYLIQDLARGGCLFDILIEMGGFGEKITAIVMRRILEAVGYLHSLGIVHRDIKLENILLAEEKDLSTVKLSDFGVAKIITESERGARSRPVMASQVGSVAYMAPEIFMGTPYDQSVDLWSCGVLLYMLLSLSSPFGNDGNDASQENHQINRIVKGDYNFNASIWEKRSKESKELISSLLSLKPDQRPSVEEALSHPWFKYAEEL